MNEWIACVVLIQRDLSANGYLVYNWESLQDFVKIK